MTGMLARATALLTVLLSLGCGKDFTGPTKADARLLTTGTALTELSGQLNERKYYRVVVPTGAAQLTITTSGGTGDVDLIVKYRDIPRVDNGDCGSVEESNDEICVFTNPPPGDYFIMLYGFAPYAGVTLLATVTVPG